MISFIKFRYINYQLVVTYYESEVISNRYAKKRHDSGLHREKPYFTGPLAVSSKTSGEMVISTTK